MMKFPDDQPIRPHPKTTQKLAHKTDPNATPYSDINLFKKGEEEHSTLERIASKEFDEILKKADEVGHLSPKEFNDLLIRISQIEASNKGKLERLAKKIIQKELGLSQDIMDNISGQLLTQEGGLMGKPVITDFDIDPKTGKLKSKGEDEDNEGEEDEEGGGYEVPKTQQEPGEEPEENMVDDGQTPIQKLGLTQEEVNQLVGETQVRKIMNSMIMGGGYKLFDVLNDFKPELDAIDRRLYRWYTMLNPNGNLTQWMIPPDELFGRRAAGSVKLKLEEPESEEPGEEQQPQQKQPGQKKPKQQRPQQEEEPEEEQPEQTEKKEIPKVAKVEAKATNFAVLLHELAKGALEYLFAIRLAGFSKNLRRAITDIADDYEAEHFHKLLGPQIWKQFFYGIEIALEQYAEHNELYGIESNRDMLPIIINKIATMQTQAFIDLVDDMLNPGEAQRNRREEPLDRLKKIIHGINMDIKEYMDEQDGHGGEIDLGEPNSNIDAAVNHNRQNWIDDIENKVTGDGGEEDEQPEPEAQQPAQKNYEDMDKNELSLALADALEGEDYQLAARLRDMINQKG